MIHADGETCAANPLTVKDMEKHNFDFLPTGLKQAPPPHHWLRGAKVIS